MLTSNIIKELNSITIKDNILTEIEERYAYSFDASDIESTNIADAVIFAQEIEEVQNIVKLANKYTIPLICRGAGTNTVGACIPVNGGIILDFSKMNKILDINSQDMTATVQPGVIVGDLQQKVEELGLFYPPDPSNLKVSTIGGSIAQNSAGARCFKYGATKDYVLDMLIVTADGELIHTGSKTIKNAVGYNMGSIFIGSEGTLGIVVQATVKLIPKPETSQVIMAYFDNINNCIESVNNIIKNKLYPSTIDFMDKNAISTVEDFCNIGLNCNKDSALIIEIDGVKESIQNQREKICEILTKNGASDIKYSTNEQESEKIWQARRSSMAACTKIKPNVTTDDIIVPRSNLANLVRGIQSICKAHNLTACLVGHVGDGSIHPQIPIDFNDEKELLEYKKAKSEIYQLAIDLNGTISGEHGIGLEKKNVINKVVENRTLNYMREIKTMFDPKNILNPNKIF